MKCRSLPSVALVLCAITLWPIHPAPAAGFTKGTPVKPFTPDFKPGDYVWHPEISPAGPVVIVVSVPDQVMYVYRNALRIGRSTVSTGKAGKRTPTGVFTVLQRKVDHTSSIYKGAKMPHMQRLTWTGIAMHAGNLPGYPASAGCVRMPVHFAEKLYGVTSLGTTVIITNSAAGSEKTSAPGLLFTTTRSERAPAGAVVWTPQKSPKGPLSMMVSSADGAVYVYRNGIEIGRAPVGGLQGLTGSYVYSALESADVNAPRDWQATVSVGGRAPNLKELISKVNVNQQFLQHVRPLVTAGTSLVLTDAPVNVSTHSSTDFSILTAQ